MKKIAYLTIDDSPSKDMTKKIDYLLSKGIPAIWFCRGNLIEKNPDKVIYAIKKGFIIGNHSYSHPHFSDLTLEECYREISKCDNLVEEIYEKAGVKRPAKFFRFPYGDKGGFKKITHFEKFEGEGKVRKERIQKFLRNLKYVQPNFEGITYKYYTVMGLLKDIDCFWTYDIMEYALQNPDKYKKYGIFTFEDVLKRMNRNEPEKMLGLNYSNSNEIILFHDHESSTKIFAPIIEKLIEKGIIFKLPRI